VEKRKTGTETKKVSQENPYYSTPLTSRPSVIYRRREIQNRITFPAPPPIYGIQILQRDKNRINDNRHKQHPAGSGHERFAERISLALFSFQREGLSVAAQTINKPRTLSSPSKPQKGLISRGIWAFGPASLSKPLTISWYPNYTIYMIYVKYMCPRQPYGPRESHTLTSFAFRNPRFRITSYTGNRPRFPDPLHSFDSQNKAQETCLCEGLSERLGVRGRTDC
jgi:hypothetical protein